MLFSSNHYHSHNTTIEEKRAPTDDSLKLLKEMKEKAVDSVIENIKVNLKPFNGDIQIIKLLDIEFGFNEELHYILSINGKDSRGKLKIDPYSKVPLMKDLLDIVSKHIASQLITEMYIKADPSIKQLF